MTTAIHLTTLTNFVILKQNNKLKDNRKLLTTKSFESNGGKILMIRSKKMEELSTLRKLLCLYQEKY